MSQSLAFDQAVSFYDQSRANPAWVMDAVVNSMIQFAPLTSTSRVLEIGIGTGRIAIPLAQRGMPVVGVDLSVPMMIELQKKIIERRVQVVSAQADANALPFVDAQFDCAYAVHVYHLVAHWQHALWEAQRVIKPGGCFFVSYHLRDKQAPNRVLRRKLFELVSEQGIDARRPGAQSYEELKEGLDQLGQTQIVDVAQWTERTVTVSRIIDELAAKKYSDTWLIPDDVMSQVIPRLREWARDKYGDLGHAVTEEEQFKWIVTRKG